MRTRTIRQTVLLPGKPEAVYEALMSSKEHGAFTHSATKISRRVGGRFTTGDGYISGTNLELVPGKKIVQKWRGAEEGWPEDHYSIATFALAAAGTKTRLTFTQTGVPSEYAEAIAQGWKDFYWEPLRAYLEA
jgi:activator of HSP90 ATPase